MKRIWLVLLIGTWGNAERAWADFLQGSSTASSVSVSLTLGSGSFSIIGGVATDTGAGIESHNVFANPATPLLLSDPSTDSLVQSSATASHSLANSGKTLGISMSTAGFAMSASSASGGGTAGSSPGITIPPSTQPTPAVFDINLMSDFGMNPASAYAVQASMAGNLNNNHSVYTTLGTFVNSGALFGGTTIFSLGVAEGWQNGMASIAVYFASDLIAQPIFASDFIAGPNGMFSLNPSKRNIQIPVMIPANPNGLDLETGTTSSVSIVPEPASFIPALFALIGLLGFARKRR